MVKVLSPKARLLADESDFKNILSLRRNKYNLTSPASNGQQQPSQPQPTMADTGRNEKWHPSAPHKALRLAPSSLLDGGQPPEQADSIIFWGVAGVYGPQNTTMLWQCSLPEQRSSLRDIYPLTPPPPQYICLLGGLLPMNPTRGQAQCLLWGIKGPFPMATAMVVIVVVCVLCMLEHKPLLSGGTMANWVTPESSRLKQDGSCGVLMLRYKCKREMEK